MGAYKWDDDSPLYRPSREVRSPTATAPHDVPGLLARAERDLAEVRRIVTAEKQRNGEPDGRAQRRAR